MNIELIEQEGELFLYVPSNKRFAEIKELLSKIKNDTINVVKVDRLSLDQMKLIWSLCNDYGELRGYTREEMREALENEFCNSKEIEYFSISPFKRDCCSMKVATDFIQFIIEHAIKHDYNLIVYEGKGDNRVAKRLQDIAPDIRRYVIQCLLHKRCAVCGKLVEVDLHHWDSVATIGGYKYDDGLQTRFLPLCREHHTEFHNIGKDRFSNKWHIEGVMLSKNLVKELKKVYPHHFQAFEEGKNGI